MSSGNRGAPISGLFAVAEQMYPGIEQEVGLSSAALRAGELVRDMRKGNGWTQTQLAEMLGWDQVRMSNIERGEGTRGPTFDVMTKIAEACGYDWQFTPREVAKAVPNENEPEDFARRAIIHPSDLDPFNGPDFGESVPALEAEAPRSASPLRRGLGQKRMQGRSTDAEATDPSTVSSPKAAETD
ncbi:MAG TPA: helix-turn-helix transcriptional regulator [Pseudolabrys sp.]